jgi:hypothetical protein
VPLQIRKTLQVAAKTIKDRRFALVLQLPSLHNGRVILSRWFLDLLWRLPQGQDVDLLLDPILVVGSVRAQTYRRRPLLLFESGEDYKKIEEWVLDTKKTGLCNYGKEKQKW